MDRMEQSLRPRRGPMGQHPFNVQSALFSKSNQETISALFAPMHYERGYAYPLLVWLHGRGADEGQLMRIMPQVSLRNFVAVAPQGIPLPGSPRSNREVLGWSQSADSIQRAEQRVFDAIDAARQKYHIAPRRVFLAGFGCGGTMAFRVAMNRPSRFAGVLSLCGPFSHENTPFGNLAEARRLPVFLAAGRDSREYPSNDVCRDLRLFHTAGLSITLRQYPCGQEISPRMLSDMNCWIMEQLTPASPSGEQAEAPDPDWRHGESDPFGHDHH